MDDHPALFVIFAGAMTLILTGSPTRFGEDHFTEDNGLLAEVRAALPSAPRVLLVSAAPDDRKFTDYLSVVVVVPLLLTAASTIPATSMISRLASAGGMEAAVSADGLVMGCSAGSMNCAERVYSHPELPGESAAPRWLEGLGLTTRQIVPHYDQVRHAEVDGLRLFEDLVFPDSWRQAFYTFPDGGYIISKDGREELRGLAWEISNGQMRRISAENQTYAFMNVIFISPHFPQTYSHFCAGLRANGANVLGIADAPWHELNDELRGALTDYYKVNNLEDYGEVYRAVAWFSHKYGKIDWIESNNEYWLEQDARLRTDFNVTTGIKSDRVAAIRNKSEMKKYYALGGIPTARQI